MSRAGVGSAAAARGSLIAQPISRTLQKTETNGNVEPSLAERLPLTCGTIRDGVTSRGAAVERRYRGTAWDDLTRGSRTQVMTYIVITTVAENAVERCVTKSLAITTIDSLEFLSDDEGRAADGLTNN